MGLSNVPRFGSYSFETWADHWRDALLWDPLASFTVVLALSTVALWLATRKLWKGAEAQAILQYRAYVGIDRIDVTKIPMESEEPVSAWKFEFWWTNSGSTPARNLSIISGHYLHDKVMTKDHRYDKQNTIIRNFNLRPNGEAAGTIVIPTKLLTAYGPRMKLYVYTSVEYDDIYSRTRRRRTEFCAEVLFSEDCYHRSCVVNMPLYGPYNGADEDCLFKPREKLLGSR
ncbi:hypothetical protein Q9Q95_04790 [Sphingomonas sp. DG1-23]|uniref:hypothetical protein n=1 Tax=Sphingomonas sp. DG1-23 TaxID=3068316 RepID=UPI00273EC7B5|nr:hypothetical protein [Sphingomonas sp. DG1-23]MDP5278232.1 hypothetical protein [Sphingomonas sp. DG1-23]